VDASPFFPLCVQLRCRPRVDKVDEPKTRSRSFESSGQSEHPDAETMPPQVPSHVASLVDLAVECQQATMECIDTFWRWTRAGSSGGSSGHSLNPRLTLLPWPSGLHQVAGIQAMNPLHRWMSTKGGNNALESRFVGAS